MAGIRTIAAIRNNAWLYGAVLYKQITIAIAILWRGEGVALSWECGPKEREHSQSGLADQLNWTGHERWKEYFLKSLLCLCENMFLRWWPPCLSRRERDGRQGWAGRNRAQKQHAPSCIVYCTLYIVLYTTLNTGTQLPLPSPSHWSTAFQSNSSFCYFLLCSIFYSDRAVVILSWWANVSGWRRNAGDPSVQFGGGGGTFVRESGSRALHPSYFGRTPLFISILSVSKLTNRTAGRNAHQTLHCSAQETIKSSWKGSPGPEWHQGYPSRQFSFLLMRSTQVQPTLTENRHKLSKNIKVG